MWGYSCNVVEYNLAGFLDTALTSLPFYCLGYVVKNTTNWLAPSRYDKYLWIVAPFIIVLLILLSVKMMDYRTNTYDSVISTYVGGLIGTIMIFAVSKSLNYLPIISYYGRYSIIILCTHFLLIELFTHVVEHFSSGSRTNYILVFLITSASFIIIIPLVRKLLPHVTAQKNLFKI